MAVLRARMQADLTVSTAEFRVRVRIMGTIIGRLRAVTRAMMPRTTSISIKVNADCELQIAE